MVKNSSANAGDMDSIPDPGRSPEVRYGNPFQFSCLENPMDRGASELQSMEVTKSWIAQLNTHTHTHTHTHTK